MFTSGFWEPIATPFAGLSLIGWAGSTVLLVLLGLLVAAVLPRQTRASEERIAGHFWSSLGWGALTALVIVPLITLALVVTIIGILVAIPWVFAAVAVFLFGYLAFGAFFGRSLLRLVGYRGDSLMLAVTVGVIASQLVRLIPYVGAPIVAVMWMIGGGGAIAAFFVWRRSTARRRRPDAERGGRADSCASRPDAGGERVAAAGADTAAPAAAQMVATVTWLAPPVKRIS